MVERTLDELTETLEDRRTPAEVRRGAWRNLGVMALAGGWLWWMYASGDDPVFVGALGLLVLYGVVREVRSLRTGHGYPRANRDHLAKHVLEASWPDAPIDPDEPATLRSRALDLLDRLETPPTALWGLLERVLPWLQGVMAVFFVVAAAALLVLGLPPAALLAGVMAVVSGAIGFIVHRQNRRRDEAKQILDDVLERLSVADGKAPSSGSQR